MVMVVAAVTVTVKCGGDCGGDGGGELIVKPQAFPLHMLTSSY